MLVGGAITILKNMKVGDGKDDISYIMDNNPFMFETTNQYWNISVLKHYHYINIDIVSDCH
jgi:ribosomal protein L31